MDALNRIVLKINDIVWGMPLIIFILAVGIYLTVRLGVLQIRHLPKALKFMVKNEEGGDGEVSSFGALCTALSATIGTGNIVGVATAVCSGGPGALFWMWMAAFFGMATKYAEGVLAIKYRTVDENGHVLGGPFYYIERGMGKRWKWLAKLFAFFGVCVGLFSIGTFTQINGITSAADRVFNSQVLFTLGSGDEKRDITLAVVICGALVTFFAALVIIGGVKRIAKVSSVVVPFMAVAYVLFAVAILICNAQKIPAAVSLACQSAFNVKAVGGAIVGLTLKTAIQKGVGRGIFSNESGLGSAPIAAAAAKTHSCVRQGLVSMTGTFVDTIIICTITGLTIIVTGAWNPNVTGQNLDAFNVTAWAWEQGLPINNELCVIILSLCLAFFAFTTILGWDYYAERCVEYLLGGKKKGALLVFRIIYIVAVAVGPYLTVSAVWGMADIFNGLMAFPNLVALVFLSGVVGRETKAYFEKGKLKLPKA